MSTYTDVRQFSKPQADKLLRELTSEELAGLIEEKERELRKDFPAELGFVVNYYEIDGLDAYLKKTGADLPPPPPKGFILKCTYADLEVAKMCDPENIFPYCYRETPPSPVAVEIWRRNRARVEKAKQKSKRVEELRKGFVEQYTKDWSKPSEGYRLEPTKKPESKLPGILVWVVLGGLLAWVFSGLIWE